MQEANSVEKSNTIEIARFNMVEQQIRPADVLDARVLNLMGSMPREAFVPTQYQDLAYADEHIPIGFGQIMLKPIQEARFLQALDVQPGEKILEIGTGSGFMTALLANLGGHVYSVEIVPELAQGATQSLERHGINNATVEVGDAAEGWSNEAPYDVIAVTGSMPILSESLKQQLNPGGRLIVAVGSAPIMSVLLITRVDENQWSEESVFETHVPPLKNVRQPQAFVF
jgi:protein-L-isoaspartate(D-aspartate) O-methyltransferase